MKVNYFPKQDKSGFCQPCVSVGNVGQLATDLIISSLNLEKVGIIYHSSILPVIGNDPYTQFSQNNCRLTTPCEVYENSSQDLVVLQQRSPLIKGKKEEFVTWLSDWIKENRFKQIIILTSSFAHERVDSQIFGCQLRILMSKSVEEKNGKLFLETLKWKEVEKRHGDEMTDSIFLPGSGMAKQLFHKCSESSVLMMSLFCSEGDNIQDSITLCNCLNSWLHLIGPSKNIHTWKTPESWKLVYGSHFDQTLFH
ncbi:hypothetical protein LOTGIDRAFT_155694 [Lottia gigantea]|uniref:Proteasome assembly chaperone 2 n=1 Tax=Lottia gigantea TaxID=225164 RepID=V3YX83_LOTGI|nr:hypothetical protein LOTGIDRAFT_155694 [Lottia gigantea]ESO82678.1 hypothetical protein LOTGIDRAFT_155694 [Lottia gigantea]